ncbi:hypothetical protein TCAL_09467 [Tigriopus californicus]|uniref:Sulfotransferase domain-containing protein n=1 Tax=Tigriopus californicus TaxID=6832 RepID=A0A553PM57_TIGCA|nr:uncharacterized protein LOC131890602 [Tigriopus californicus]TRY78757.1 hypothetical protein TCAL_09467 [Tigriopus californicus]|eukprot:TCALIF_09467-PA protein Name:"Protein of unknown function" AED:0.01 eAED:0.01 QI:80/1/0.66/1/1/1/3/0/236
MKSALGTLLNGACYHMMSMIEGSPVEPAFWAKALKGGVTPQEWRDFLGGRGYRAGVDYPISRFYRELIEAYPNAKVILTTRDPETWYKSVKGTIYKASSIVKKLPVYLFLKLMGRTLTTKVMDDLEYLPAKGMDKGIFTVIEEGPESAQKYFEEWVESVKECVPKDRLLVFEVKEGWKPLCQFLDLPIPNVPFPRLNDTASMAQTHSNLEYLANAIVFGIPAFVGFIFCMIYTYYG